MLRKLLSLALAETGHRTPAVPKLNQDRSWLIGLIPAGPKPVSNFRTGDRCGLPAASLAH
jgi:hypothetical protein